MTKHVLATLATFGALSLNGCSVFQIQERQDDVDKSSENQWESVSDRVEDGDGTVVRVWQPDKSNYHRFVFKGSSATDMYFWSAEAMLEPESVWASDVVEVNRLGYTTRPFVYRMRDEEYKDFIDNHTSARLIDVRMISVKYGASNKSFTRYVVRLDTDGDEKTAEYVGTVSTCSVGANRIRFALKRPERLEAEEDALRLQTRINANLIFVPLREYCERLAAEKPKMYLSNWNKTFLIFKKIPISRIRE